jgi:hypothetical protein
MSLRLVSFVGWAQQRGTEDGLSGMAGHMERAGWSAAWRGYVVLLCTYLDQVFYRPFRLSSDPLSIDSSLENGLTTSRSTVGCLARA